MNENVFVVGINGDFIDDKLKEQIAKTNKNRNIDLNHLGCGNIIKGLDSLFLKKQLSDDDKTLLSATIDLELEFWLKKYKNENDNKKEMSVSCLLEVLMWNIVFKNFNQLNDDNRNGSDDNYERTVLSRLRKNFNRLVKKLVNGYHKLNFEEMVNSGNFVTKTLDYSMTEIFAGIDIPDKSKYVEEIKNEIKAVPQFFSKETEKYKGTSEYKNWFKTCKESNWNCNINNPAYLLITNSDSKSNPKEFNYLVWNNNYKNVLSCQKNFIEQENVRLEINPEENNILDLNNEEYDKYILSGGENGSFQHIGFPLDKTLAICKNSFSNLLLLSYLVEEKYSDRSKYSENEFYKKKRLYLETVFEQVCRNKYNNKLIQDGFIEFKKILSDRKIKLDKSKLNKIMDSYFSNRELPMIIDEDNYTDNYILGNLERFFYINNGEAKFKNKSCKLEFEKLKIREGTPYENFSRSPINKHVSWEEINKLIQITNFIPISELLKMNFESKPVSINFGHSGYTDYISKYIIKLERINDLNDESSIDGVGNCKEIVNKIFKYATIGENKNSNQSYKEIKELIESKKIILNANNHDVIKALLSCVGDKFGKYNEFELIKSLYSNCQKTEGKFINELIDNFFKFKQKKDGLVLNKLYEDNLETNLISNNVKFIAKIKMECGEKDLAKHLIKYYAKTNLLDIYFEKEKNSISVKELAENLFEFKYPDNIIESDKLYFFSIAQQIYDELKQKDKSDYLSRFKEILCSLTFNLNDNLDVLLKNFDKDLFLSLDFAREIFYIGETVKYSHNELKNGQMKGIYAPQYKYRYTEFQRKKFLSFIINQFHNNKDVNEKVFKNMLEAHAKKKLCRDQLDFLFLETDDIDCLKSLMQVAISYDGENKLEFEFQVVVHIIDAIAKNKSGNDNNMYELFSNFIFGGNINFVFSQENKSRKNSDEQIFWPQNYIHLAENILIKRAKSMKNFMDDILFKTVEMLFAKSKNINHDFIKTLLTFNYEHKENKCAGRKMSKEKQNDIWRVKIIKLCLDSLESKNQKCSEELAKLFYSSIVDDVDGAAGIALHIKKIGFEFEENKIDEVLGDKWKNERCVVEELFGKEVADKREKLNLENKNQFEVKKAENNIHLKPEDRNNDKNNSGTEKQNQDGSLNKKPKQKNENNNKYDSGIGQRNELSDLNKEQISYCVNEEKNRKWDIYLCLIFSICVIVFSFIFSFWILFALFLPIFYSLFCFYCLKKLKRGKKRLVSINNNIGKGTEKLLNRAINRKVNVYQKPNTLKNKKRIEVTQRYNE